MDLVQEILVLQGSIDKLAESSQLRQIAVDSLDLPSTGSVLQDVKAALHLHICTLFNAESIASNAT